MKRHRRFVTDNTKNITGGPMFLSLMRLLALVGQLVYGIPEVGNLEIILLVNEFSVT